MSKTARTLSLVGSLVLVATALFHGSGIGDIRAALGDSSLAPFFVGLFGGLWLFFAWHLVVIALPPLYVAMRRLPGARAIVAFCGLVAFGDFVWVVSLAGFFPGSIALLLGSLCLLAAAGAWRRPA